MPEKKIVPMYQSTESSQIGQMPKKQKRGKKNPNYVSKDHLREALLVRGRYQDMEMEIPEVLEEYIGDAIWKIAYNYSCGRKWGMYPDRMELVSTAVEKCWSVVENRKYNPEAGTSPLAYFTQCSHFMFCEVSKQRQKRFYIQNQAMLRADSMGLLADGQVGGLAPEDTLVAGQIIADYEERHMKPNKGKKPIWGLEEVLVEEVV